MMRHIEESLAAAVKIIAETRTPSLPEVDDPHSFPMGIKFIDGPAKNASLMLRRSPVLLRVTQDTRTKNFDALDSPDDEPRVREKLFLYIICRSWHPTHLRMSGKAKSGSGFYANADYRLFDFQPADELMRSNDAWNLFCKSVQSDILTNHVPIAIRDKFNQQVARLAERRKSDDA